MKCLLYNGSLRDIIPPFLESQTFCDLWNGGLMHLRKVSIHISLHSSAVFEFFCMSNNDSNSYNTNNSTCNNNKYDNQYMFKYQLEKYSFRAIYLVVFQQCLWRLSAPRRREPSWLFSWQQNLDLSKLLNLPRVVEIAFGNTIQSPSLVLVKSRKDLNNVSCPRDMNEIMLKAA